MKDNSRLEKIKSLLRDKLQSLLQERKIDDFKLLLSIFFLLGLFSLASSLFSSENKKQSPQEPPAEAFSADTFIPAGKVLVPLEIANAESLEGLIGEVGGIVDLFTTTPYDGKKNQKVGTRLKIMKAPLNPRQFAVLVDEETSQDLLQYPGPFLAVIQNPRQTAGKIQKQKTINRKSAPRVDIVFPNVESI